MDDSMTPDTLAAEVKDALGEWEKTQGQWVEEAEEAYAMVVGDQWTDEDAEAMREMKRPMVTMNRIAAMIRGVCGLEISQRMEARYLGREMSDSQAVELHNAMARWVREGCNAEDEESDGFRDLLTCGLGWTETRVCYENDPDGEIIIERVDPLEMRWDPMAVRRGLTDSRWRARIKSMALEDVKRLWPDKAEELEAWVEGEDRPIGTHVNPVGDGYQGKGTGTDGEVKDEVKLTQYQYFTHDVFVQVLDPTTGQQATVSEKAYQLMTKAGMPGVAMTRFKKRVFRQAIVCGSVVLEDKPLKTSDFTLQCMTGARDRNAGIWYGLVRDLQDPQRWGNKFFSTIIDTLATNAKGGVMAETSAVEDPRRFEEDWANPRATVWLKAGGLAKIQNRPPPAIPQAMQASMEFALSAMPMVSGINLEFLGMADRNQPGILEYHRKQSVAASLAEFFSALRQYRKTQGKVLLEMIYAFIPEGRVVRVTGPTGEQYLPFYKAAEPRFDVVVDEAATAPDRKMQTWLAVTELLPVALKAGMPVPPSILDYSPLPQALAQEWKEMLSKAPQIPPEVQKQIEEGQKRLQQLEQENMALKDRKAEAQAQLQLKAQEQQMDQQAALVDMQMARDKVVAELQMERERMAAELEMERQRHRHQMALEREKAENQAQLAREKAVLDAQVKETVGMANASAQYTFERQGKKITAVRDSEGRRFVVDRDAAGQLRGLRADEPTTLQ